MGVASIWFRKPAGRDMPRGRRNPARAGLCFVRFCYVNVARGVVGHAVGDAAQDATDAAHPSVAYNNECSVMLFGMFDESVRR